MPYNETLRAGEVDIGVMADGGHQGIRTLDPRKVLMRGECLHHLTYPNHNRRILRRVNPVNKPFLCRISTLMTRNHRIMQRELLIRQVPPLRGHLTQAILLSNQGSDIRSECRWLRATRGLSARGSEREYASRAKDYWDPPASQPSWHDTALA